MNLTGLYNAIDSASVEANSQLGFHCERGCSHCCYSLVRISAIEAQHIIDRVKIDKELKHKIQKRAVLVKGLTVKQVHTLRSPCPFLKDGECSIYEHRPIRCRSYCSVSVTDCQKFLEGTIDKVPICKNLMQAGDRISDKCGDTGELSAKILEILSGNS